MAYGNWDEIVGEYVKLYLPSRFSEHARGMIELIPRLRKDPALFDMIPITSHGTLILKYPDSKTEIKVWCEQAEKEFRVYLDNGDKEYDEQFVANGDVIPTIRQYAGKLRALAAAHH